MQQLSENRCFYRKAFLVALLCDFLFLTLICPKNPSKLFEFMLHLFRFQHFSLLHLLRVDIVYDRRFPLFHSLECYYIVYGTENAALKMVLIKVVDYNIFHKIQERRAVMELWGENAIRI